MKKEIIRPAVFPFYDYTKYTFSLAVKKGNFLFLSGQTASRYEVSDDKVMCKGDIAEQAAVSYAKFKTILESAGSNFNDLVKTVDYIAPIGRADYGSTDVVRRTCFSGKRPAATGVVINRLVRPDALLEVDAIAVLGGEKREVKIPQGSLYKDLTFRPAVGKGDVLFLSGQASVDRKNGRVKDKGDVAAQTRQVYQSLALLLEAAGCSFGDVVKTTEYVVPAGLGDYLAAADARREICNATFPASTRVVVSALLEQDLLIEVDAVAVLAGERSEINPPEWHGYNGPSFPQAVKKGNLLFVSAQPGLDQTSGEVKGEGDVVAQMRQAYQNVGSLLEAAGSGFADVMKTTDYIIPAALKNYRKTADVRREFFGEEFPASTAVVVEQLSRKASLVEVEVIAVLD
jgi:enamine deaminase RidA (YjgF/YER057c/UK114 family)